MTTTQRSTVIGVFPSRDQADRAIDDLRRAGFSYDQIRLVERGAGSFLDNLKSLFLSQETSSSNTADDLKKIGIPEQNAQDYQRELDAGRVIVLIKAIERPEQAIPILRQSGAYNIESRMTMAEPNVQPGAQSPPAQPGVQNPPAQPAAQNPPVQPAAQNPPVQPGTQNPPVQPGTQNPPAQQGPAR